MTPLESRKRLLLAESELNRALFMEEWETLAGEVHTLVRRAGTVTALVSAAATLGIGAGLFRRKTPAPEAAKPSWPQKILKGAEVVFALWPMFRSRDRA